MPDVLVSLYCVDCQDVSDEMVEMIGEDIILENKQKGFQVREYKCPLCGHSAQVMLDFGGDNARKN